MKGKTGAADGIRAGCVLIVILLALILPVFAALRELFAWLGCVG